MVLASLAAQSERKVATVAVSVIAFSVCFLALLSGGILAVRGAGEMAPLKFIIFLAYAGFYGLFGLAFSFLAGKSTTNETGIDA